MLPLQMKKLYLLLLPVLLLAAACSNEDDAPRAQDACAIDFQPVGEDGTRAAIEGQSDITLFNVWGWATDSVGTCTRIFNCQPVTFNDGRYTYSPKVYWLPYRTYNFLALVTSNPSAESLQTTASDIFTAWENSASVDFTLNAPYDEDILYATATENTDAQINYARRVPLSFRHMLSRLQVHVRSLGLDGCHVRLRSISFRPTYSACIFAPVLITTTEEIPPTTPYGRPTDVTSTDVQMQITSTTAATNAYTLLSDNTSGHQMPLDFDYLYLIPGAAGTFTVTYELWQNEPALRLKTYNDEFQATLPLLGGHSYQSTIYLPSPAVVVSMQTTLEPWGEDNDTDREILSI